MMNRQRRKLMGLAALAIWIAGALLPYASAAGLKRSSREPAETHSDAAQPKHTHEHNHTAIFEIVSGEDLHACSHCTAACYEGRGHVCMDPPGAQQDHDSTELIEDVGTAGAPCIQPHPCPMGGDEAFGMPFAPMQFRALPPAEPWGMPTECIPIESTEDTPTSGHTFLTSPPPESKRPIA